MKKILLSLFVFITLVAAIQAHAVTALSVYKANQALESKTEKALNPLILTISMDEEGIVMEGTIYRKGDKERIETTIKKGGNPMMGKVGDTIIVIDDGTTSTVFSPVLGKLSNPSEAQDESFEAPQNLSLLGKETVYGISAHKLRGTFSRQEKTLWISVKEHLLVKESDGTTTTVYTDFRKVKGFQVPHKVITLEDNRPLGTTLITSVKTGMRLKESLFDPASIKGYESAKSPGMPINEGFGIMGQIMEMGVKIEELRRQGKEAEADALEKKLEAMARELEGAPQQ